MKKIAFLLIVIFSASLLVRFWNLAEYPKSLSMDEVSFGYDAYSILKTGRDQYGQKFPLAFKSLGDYKLPVDVYLTSISIAVFDLNEFAIRFPVAILGALTPIVFIFFLRELKISWPASLVTGFWLSLLGWHIFLSRASFETIVALFFIILGTWLFVVWEKRKKPQYLILSVLFFSLSVWTYNAERLFVPLLSLSLLFIFRGSLKEIINKPRKYFLALVVVLLFAAPFFYLLVTGNSILSRANDLWIGRDNTLWTGQYLNYFDPKFWFWKGVKITPPDYPDVGLIYLVDIPIFLLGVYALTKSKNRTLKALTLVWFFLGPLPASFTRGDESPIRFLIFLPFFVFVMASGFETLFTFHLKRIFVSVYLLFLLVNFVYFWDLYRNNFYKFSADLWHYGYREVVQYACQNRQKYDKIIITDKYGIEWPSIKTIPYLYVLFHCNWDPGVYLKDRNLYNIEFRQPQWRIDSKEKNFLLIGSRWDFPENFDKSKIMKTIYFPESPYEPKPAFYFVETGKK